MGRRKKKRKQPADVDDGCWDRSFDEPIWALDYTSGGAPIGLTKEEFERAQHPSWHEPEHDVHWVEQLVRHTATIAIELWMPESDPEIVRVEGPPRLHDRFGYRCDVRYFSRSGESQVRLQIRLLAPDATEDSIARTLTEAALLSRIDSSQSKLRIPKRAVAVELDGCTLLVRDHLPGFEFEIQKTLQPLAPAWCVLGEAAAAVHDIATAPVEGLLSGFATRRAHAEHRIRWLKSLQADGADAAWHWALEQLPLDEPSTLLHGDLSGGNVLIGVDKPNAIIDWETTTLGDPAFELALLTRGSQKPFGTLDGLQRLLDAYASSGGRPLRIQEVRLHELCTMAEQITRRGIVPHPRSKNTLRKQFLAVLERALRAG